MRSRKFRGPEPRNTFRAVQPPALAVQQAGIGEGIRFYRSVSRPNNSEARAVRLGEHGQIARPGPYRLPEDRGIQRRRIPLCRIACFCGAWAT
jgi:hypothetical protein